MSLVGFLGGILLVVGVMGVRNAEDPISVAVSCLVSAIGIVVAAIGVVLHSLAL